MLRALVPQEVAQKLKGEDGTDNLNGSFVGEVNKRRALITVGVWHPTAVDPSIPDGTHFVRAEILHPNQRSADGLPEAGARQDILDSLKWEDE